MNFLLLLSTILLTISAFLMIIKFFRVPTTIDKIVASDTLTAIVVCILGVIIVVAKFESLLITMVCISLVSFVGSLTLARLYVLKKDPISSKESEIEK